MMTIFSIGADEAMADFIPFFLRDFSSAMAPGMAFKFRETRRLDYF